MAVHEVRDKTGLLSDDNPSSAKVPEGWDRRAFMMRNRRVDFDTTVSAMALSGKEMSLAVSLVLC